METRVEQQEDVAHLGVAAVLNGYLFEGERRDSSPHVKGPADGFRAPLRAQFVMDVLQTGLNRLHQSEVELETFCTRAGSVSVLRTCK